MISIQNLSKENIEAALALSVDDWQRKYVRTNAEMIASAYVQPQELFPIALYAEEEMVGLAFVKKEKKAAKVLRVLKKACRAFADRRKEKAGRPGA